MTITDDTRPATTETADLGAADQDLPTHDLADRDTRRRRWTPRRIITWAVVAVVGAVALMYAGIFFYATVLNDAPDRLDNDDLSAALVEPEEATAAIDATTPAADTPAASAAPAEAATPATTAGVDGVWTPTEASEFGYRVDEVLSGVNVTAVGRSNQIDGALTIDGTSADIDVTVQVADIRSDNGSRDGQFRGRIMSADEFPTARFVTTNPIEFDTLPEAGEQVTVTATGELTLRGETRPVTFDVTAELAATDGGDRIGVLGSIPIVFDDFGIPEPSIGSVSVEDNGLIEFVLVFER